MSEQSDDVVSFISSDLLMYVGPVKYIQVYKKCFKMFQSVGSK